MGQQPVHRNTFADVMPMDRRQLLRRGGLFSLLAAMPATAFAKGVDGRTYPAIEAAINSYVNDRKVASMMAAIGFGTGDPDYVTAGTRALDIKEPVDGDTLWRVYSMTKPITGMAAMILIDEGKLGLDQEIADFIPEFAEMTVLTDPDNSLDAVPAKNRITVRHLLTHTAGLGYTIVTKGPLLAKYNELGISPAEVSKNPLPGIPVPAPTPPIDEFARRVASLPLIAEPGTRWSYSIALDLLGYVIQLASGVEFGKFLQTRMFDPLGMNNSYFTVPTDQIGHFTTNYAPFGGTLIPVDPANNSIYAEPPAFPFGGAGLVCSAHDYDRFLQMLLNKGALGGNRVMSEMAAMKGMSNLLPEGASLAGTWIEGQGFGAGGRVGLDNGTYGWSGAAGTVAFVDNKRGFRASLYTQYIPSDAYPIPREFPELVYRDLAG